MTRLIFADGPTENENLVFRMTLVVEVLPSRFYGFSRIRRGRIRVTKLYLSIF